MQNKINSGKVKHLKQPWGSQGKKINFSFGASHEVLIDYSLKCSLTNEKEKLKLVLQILKFQSFQVPLTQNIPLCISSCLDS